MIKQVVQDKNRANRIAQEREKVVTREEVLSQVDELLNTLRAGGDGQQPPSSANNPEEAGKAFEALKIPRKFLADALAHVMLATLDKPEAELLPQLALAYKKDGGPAYLEALQASGSQTTGLSWVWRCMRPVACDGLRMLQLQRELSIFDIATAHARPVSSNECVSEDSFPAFLKEGWYKF